MRRISSSLALAILLLVAFVVAASANGGTVQISSVPSGPYQLSAFTSPNPIRVGIVDVSVLVQPAGSTDVVPVATVRVSAEPVGHDGARGTFEATHDLATNKLYYAANVALPTEGRWRIGIEVRGQAGEGAASFEVDASRETLLDRPLVLLGLIALPVLVVLAWIVVRARAAGGR